MKRVAFLHGEAGRAVLFNQRCLDSRCDVEQARHGDFGRGSLPGRFVETQDETTSVSLGGLESAALYVGNVNRQEAGGWRQNPRIHTIRAPGNQRLKYGAAKSIGGSGTPIAGVASERPSEGNGAALIDSNVRAEHVVEQIKIEAAVLGILLGSVE